MKYKLILFLFFNLAGLLLIGCVKDEPEILNNSPSEPLVFHKKFEDLIKQEKFYRAISKIPKKGVIYNKGNAFGKTVMENQYGFTISRKLVNEIKTDSSSVYTMLITRNDSIPNVLENLVVEINNKNFIESYMIKYTSNNDLKGGNFNQNIENSTKSITSIIYNDTPIIQGLNVVCKTTKIIHCTASNHGDPGTICTNGYSTYEVVCEGSGGGGGSVVGDPIVTSPIQGGGAGSNSIVKDPCVSLKKISNPQKSDLNNKIIALRNQMPNNPSPIGENGYSLQVSTDGVVLLNFPIPVSQTNGMQIPYGQNIYGSVHTHKNGLQQIFSFIDVVALWNTQDQCSQQFQDDVVIILVNESGTTFSIKVENPNLLLQFLNNFLVNGNYQSINNPKDRIDAMNSDFGKEIERNWGPSKDLLRGFLKVTEFAAISTFEKTITGWSKVTLPQFISQPLIKTPCI